MKREKEYLYVGHYVDVNGDYILKIGTAKDLDERQKQHNSYYKKSKRCPLAKNSSFEYDWYIKLSKYNTLRYEDDNKELWQDLGIGEFIQKDRFCCKEKPSQIKIKIKKEYEIFL